MSQFQRFMKRVSLSEVLDTVELPVLVQVNSSCILHGVEVLRKDQYLTIINREISQVVVGKDASGHQFRLSVKDNEDLLVDVVEEFYPETIDDVLKVVSNVKYLVLKQKFGFKNDICEPGERFMYSDGSERASEDGESSISFIRESDGSIFHLPLPVLINQNLFVFVKIKERITLKTFSRSFSWQKVQFVNPPSKKLPFGIITIENISNYDTVMSATVISKDLIRYEKYPVHKLITVDVFDQTAVPEFVFNTFGQPRTPQYLNESCQIESMLHYDIYAGRLYGFVELENPLPEKNMSITCHNVNFIPGVTVTLPLNIKQRRQSFDEPVNIADSTDVPFQRKRPATLNLFDSVRNKLGKRKTKKNSPTDNSSNYVGTLVRAKSESNAIQPTDEVLPKGIRKQMSAPSDKLPSSMEYEENTSPMELASENPLYGRPSPVSTLSRSLPLESPTRLKSKPLTDFDLKRRCETSPYSFEPLTEPQHSHYDYPMQTTFYEAPFTLRPKHGIVRHISQDEVSQSQYVSLKSNASKDRCYGSPPQEIAAVVRRHGSADSGIDSPDGKKIAENINQLFSQRSLQESSHSKLRRSSSSSVEERMVPLPKSKPPIKPRRPKTFFTLNDNIQSKKLSSKDRWPSEPILDRVPSEKSDTQRPKSLEIPFENEYAEIIYARLKTTTPRYRDVGQRKEVESMNKIKALSVDEVCNLLDALKLAKHKDYFQTEMINGHFLYKIEQKALYSKMNLSKFEAKKLQKYIRGWRPCTDDLPPSSLKYADVNAWSVNNVRSELTAINLRSFATFCAENEVDGSMLNDLRNKELMDSLSSTHGIRLSSIEFERFCSYITRELSYNEEEKKSSPLRKKI